MALSPVPTSALLVPTFPQLYMLMTSANCAGIVSLALNIVFVFNSRVLNEGPSIGHSVIFNGRVLNEGPSIGHSVLFNSRFLNEGNLVRQSVQI